MTLGELTTQLQTLCHNGHATDEICISLYDGIYEIGKIKCLGDILANDGIRKYFGITCEVDNER